jgi:hypothetical protein
MQPYSVSDLYNGFQPYFSETALFLPRTSNLNQLTPFVSDNKMAQVIHYCQKGFSKVTFLLLARDDAESDQARLFVSTMGILWT